MRRLWLVCCSLRFHSLIHPCFPRVLVHHGARVFCRALCPQLFTCQGRVILSIRQRGGAVFPVSKSLFDSRPYLTFAARWKIVLELGSRHVSSRFLFNLCYFLSRADDTWFFPDAHDDSLPRFPSYLLFSPFTWLELLPISPRRVFTCWFLFWNTRRVLSLARHGAKGRGWPRRRFWK